ncbi:MAG: DUF4157 domain-containing protein [Pyrinomonadaceae bacterium]
MNKSQEKSSATHAERTPGNGFHAHHVIVPTQAGEFQRFAQAAGNQAVQRLLRAGVIRPKLSVGAPSDPAEQEADRVADRIVSSPPAAAVQRKCACGGKSAAGGTCAECQAGGGTIQRRAHGGGNGSSEAPSVVGSVLGSGGGRPLDGASRGFMETRFGHDFSRVRVHEDARAAASARAINARAYTLGHNIVFASGEYAPGSDSGRRLLAHELTHVVQQSASGGGLEGSIRRQPAGGDASPDAGQPADAGPPTFRSPTNPNGIDPSGAGFPGVTLTTHFPTAIAEMRVQLELHGLNGPNDFVSWLQAQAAHNLPGGVPDGAAAGSDQESKILGTYQTAARDVTQQATTFVTNFEQQAKDNLRNVLTTHKTQAEAEGIRYGITTEEIEKIRTPTGRGPAYTEKVIKYGMDAGSPAAKGVQAAATVLLGRRQELDRLEKARVAAYETKQDEYDHTASVLAPTPESDRIGKEIEQKKEEYGNLRTQLSAEYPALAAFSELDKGTGDLQMLAEKGAGPDMAALIGQKIKEKLDNIKKTSDELEGGSLNVWGLPKIVDVTKVQFGITDDKAMQKLVADKQADAEPGILGDIALLALNIAAIALAGPTGGLSLAVAAGVNVAVAAVHIDEYLTKEALAGTSFDKAQAISQDDPSLFWLAVEVVGAAVDVGAAASALFKTFRSLAPLVKTAQAVKEGEEALKTLQAVRTAATAERGASFAERVVARIKALRGSRGAALEVAGASKKEIELIETAVKAADAEAATGIGKAVKTATGEMNMSQSGHLFSCASPCLVLRDKYAEILAGNKDYLDELRRLEGEAEKVVQARKAAGNNADELAKVEAHADKIKQDAAALEKRIHDANPHLTAVPQEEAAVNAAKQAEAESAVTKGRLTAKTDELEKMKPLRDKPHKGVDSNSKLWQDYVSYYEDRLSCLKAGKGGVKPPLDWDAYSKFLGKFERGTEYQKGVLTGLRDEAKLAKEGTLDPEKAKLFEGMTDPVVESNVAVLEKGGKVSKTGQPVHNFPDQLIVDGATVGPGKTPKITAVSNKSREWPAKLGGAETASVRAQAIEDATEALTKYGGDVTLRRPEGPLKALYNQTVKVEKVKLIYDAKYAQTKELQQLIRDAAAGVEVNGQRVEVIFR